MGTWFQEADATLMGDTSLELVARTAVGMIEQLNPEIRGRYQITVNSIHRTLGRHFTSLVHMLFFMLDNANRHSDVARDIFRAQVTITTDGNELNMIVKSTMQSAETAAAASAKLLDTVAGLKEALDPDKVIREGGSGYAKIIAAVRYGFKQKDPKIEATYSEDDMLKISVTCDLAGLAA
jgi:Rad3-related DNA helicase